MQFAKNHISKAEAMQGARDGNRNSVTETHSQLTARAIGGEFSGSRTFLFACRSSRLCDYLRGQ